MLRTASAARPAVVYHVSSRGSDEADGRTPATAWRTIRNACLETGPGDTVLVAPGTYRHPIVPLSSGLRDRRLTFRKHGDGDVVIDAGQFHAPIVKLISRSYVTLDGFTFTNLPREGWSGVVLIRDSQGCEILNCRTDRVVRDAGDLLMATAARDLRIEGNLFWGGAQQLRFYSGCRNVLVRNNTVAVCNFFHVTVYGPVDGIRFVNNIFHLPCSGPKNNANYLLRGDVKNFSSDHNLYFSPYKNQKRIVQIQEDGTRRTLQLAEDLDDWRKKTGNDIHGLRADPLFVKMPGHRDVEADFRLKPGSPAIGAGEDGRTLGAFGVAE